MRKHGLRGGLAIVALLAAAVPASATTVDRAESLHALADDSDGAMVFNGTQAVGLNIGNVAEVVMPPQREAAVARRSPGETGLFSSYKVRTGGFTNRASGSIADGSALASSTMEDLAIEAPGLLIEAERMRSRSVTSCDGEGDAASASAGSSIGSLRVNGEEISVGGPNEVYRHIDVPGGSVEIAPLVVEPTADGDGWSTTSLRIRIATDVAAATVHHQTRHELRFGITSTQVTCAQP